MRSLLLAFTLILFITISITSALDTIINVTSFSDDSVSKLLEYGSRGNRTVYIAAYKYNNASSAMVNMSGIPIQTMDGTQIGNMTNGNFESNFSGWAILGDPNNCAEDTICPVSWCDLSNASCTIKSMFIRLTNETVFNNSAAVIGHYSKDAGTYLHSKIDLRQNMSVPNELTVLSVNMKVFSENIGTNQRVYNYYIIVDNGTEQTLWSLQDTSSSANSLKIWTPFNFSLSDYSGENITLIFRFMQDFCCGNNKQWDVTWSGTSLWYIDNVLMLSNSSLFSFYFYPDSPSIDIGDGNSKEWNYSGILNSSISVTGLSHAITEYLNVCEVDTTSNKCLVPIVLSSESAGLINLSSISLQTTDPTNPKINEVLFKSILSMHNETQIVSVNATDNSRIAFVNITLFTPSGNQTSTMQLTSGYEWNGKYTIKLDTSTLPGNYSFYLNSTDILGNSIGSGNYTFQVLPNKPQIYSGNIFSPLISINTSNVSTNITVPFRVTLSDSRIVNGTTMAVINQTIEIPVNFSKTSWVKDGMPVATDYYPYFVIDYTKLIPNKEYNVTFLATDIYGNAANASIGKFKIILQPKDVSTRSFSIDQTNETNINFTTTTNSTLYIKTMRNVSNVALSTALYDTNPGVSNFSLLGLNKYYEIEASKDLLDNLLWTVIRIYYTDQEIVNSGLSESLLRVYYNHPNGSWVAYDNQSTDYQGGVNVEGNFVWANTTHFSLFGIYILPTCSDGIQNQDETGVDCGGLCNACSSSSGNSGGGSSGGGGDGDTATYTSLTTGSSEPLANIGETPINRTVPITIEQNKTIEENKTIEQVESSSLPTGFATLIRPEFYPAISAIIIILVLACIYLFRKFGKLPIPKVKVSKTRAYLKHVRKEL